MKASSDKPCTFDKDTLQEVLDTTGQSEITYEILNDQIVKQQRFFNEKFKKRKQARINELFDANMNSDVELHKGF